MKSSQPDPSHFQKWKETFREKAHTLICIGYTRGHKKIKTDKHKEEEITEFIVGGINDWMRSHNSPPWWKYFDVHEEAPVPKEGHSGKSRPRTDIFIRWCSRLGRPEYVFEAKRLRTKGYEAGKYTGLGGIGCFTEG